MYECIPANLIPNAFRNVIELSNMINNDEIVFYTSRQLTYDDPLINKLKRSSFDCPSLVISRSIFNFENIDINYSGRLESEGREEITFLLDSFYQIKTNWEDFRKVFLHDQPITYEEIQKFIGRYIGQHYYDCMSGGMPMTTVRIIYELCQK